MGVLGSDLLVTVVRNEVNRNRRYNDMNTIDHVTFDHVATKNK